MRTIYEIFEREASAKTVQWIDHPQVSRQVAASTLQELRRLYRENREKGSFSTFLLATINTLKDSFVSQLAPRLAGDEKMSEADFDFLMKESLKVLLHPYPEEAVVFKEDIQLETRRILFQFCFGFCKDHNFLREILSETLALSPDVTVVYKSNFS